ncbi:MAG TPA: 2-amino-4-hydroxy-6-hydroxymethyldihydropteridine diphosphokinase [Planctomycetaceae bacterium]|nr:2-amino-4-hydroxy-6-hydroxymethyldihydropteridine diphosphokinase [Planctomycetaceae bacterium]
MAKCLVSLGSNLDDRAGLLRQAIAAMQSIDGVQVTAQSTLHETLPAGGPVGQGNFLNCCVLLQTQLSATALFSQLVAIETTLGRTRLIRWDARRIDIDLLLYDQVVVETSELMVPHPRMAFRRFVLEPAVEIAGTIQHPVIGWTLQRLLDHLNHTQDYVALTGSGAHTVFDQLSATDYELVSERHLPASGPSLTRGLELQRHRLQVLQRVDWERSQRFVISDFWAGEATTNSEPEPGTVVAELATTPQPKLVVVVELPAAPSGPRQDHTTGATPGPYLFLHGQSVDNAVQEIEGALLSMKPS